MTVNDLTTITDTLNCIIDDLKAEQQTIEMRLARGVADNYAEYRHWCGMHAGLVAAENVISERINALIETYSNG